MNRLDFRAFILVYILWLSPFYNFTFAYKTIDIDSPTKFSRLYVFGDSLSDTGNTFELLSGTLPESPPYYKGRFSNGLVWVENLSKQLNIPKELVINYAFGGARAMQDSLPIPSLEKQVTQYIKYNTSADPNALYVVWAGANDVMNDVDKLNYKQIMKAVSSRVTAQLRILINHGAKTFFIPNLPNISSTPLAQEKDALYGNKKYSEHINEMTLLYNQLLAVSLDNLQREFPEVHFINFDTYDLINESSDILKSYGIKFFTQRCNPNWFAYNLLSSCSNPQEYLFWDTVHPTGTIHIILAQFILESLQENGYGAHDSLVEPNAHDLLIMQTNLKAIKSLTSKKLDLFSKELILRNKLIF